MQERLFQTPLRKTRLCTMIEYPGVVYEWLILWNIDAVFSFDYKGEKGTVTLCLGFPDYNKKGQNAEFEITIHSLNSDNRLSPRDKKKLESQLLSEMDKQKSLVYSNFIDYLKKQKK